MSGQKVHTLVVAVRMNGWSPLLFVVKSCTTSEIIHKSAQIYNNGLDFIVIYRQENVALECRSHSQSSSGLCCQCRTGGGIPAGVGELVGFPFSVQIVEKQQQVTANR